MRRFIASLGIAVAVISWTIASGGAQGQAPSPAPAKKKGIQALEHPILTAKERMAIER